MTPPAPLLLAAFGVVALSCAARKTGEGESEGPSDAPADGAGTHDETGPGQGSADSGAPQGDAHVRRVGVQPLEDELPLGGSIVDAFGAAVASGHVGEGAQALVVVGAPDAEAGEVQLFDGDGTLVGQLWGPELGEGAGSGLVVGDLDHDGYPDLVVGARRSAVAGEEAGALYVVPGPVSGDGALDTVGTRWLGEAADMVGGAMATGDVDGDEVLDLVIGAGRSGQGADKGGAVYLLRGGLAATACADCSLAAEGEIIAGTIDFEHAGTSVATGDVDGDGVDDVLIGAFGADSAAGAAYLLRGPVQGDRDLPVDAVLRVAGSGAYDLLGYAVAMADLDGDGHDEVIVGAPGDDDVGQEAGGVFVFDTVGMGLTESDARATVAGLAYANTGWSMTSADDIDGDGREDLLVGAPGDVDGRGSAWLVYGPLSGSRIFDRTLDAWWRSEVSPASLGAAVATGPSGFVLGAPEVGLVMVVDPWPLPLTDPD